MRDEVQQLQARLNGLLEVVALGDVLDDERDSTLGADVLVDRLVPQTRGAKRVAAGQLLQVLVVEAVLAEAARERRLEPREVLRLAGLQFFSACSEAT